MTDAPVTVLVVDDERTSRSLLSRSVAALGHVVEEVDRGDRALERLGAQQPAIDLVLLDLVMPGMDGREVLARIRADLGMTDLPVIVVSAVADDAVVAEAITAGATDYLVKPFAGPVLRARVEASVVAARLRSHERETLELVQLLARAARTVEHAEPIPEELGALGRRADEIGDLAKVVSAMARHVANREAALRHEVTELRIQLDQHLRLGAVAEISSSEHYRRLRAEASELRSLLGRTDDRSGADEGTCR